MKIQCKSVIGTPILDLNSLCSQCCFLDISGFDKCLPYPWYECRPPIQFKKSKCEVFKL